MDRQIIRAVTVAIEEQELEAPAATERHQAQQVCRQLRLARFVERTGGNEPAVDGGGDVDLLLGRWPGGPAVEKAGGLDRQMRGREHAIASRFHRFRSEACMEKRRHDLQ